MMHYFKPKKFELYKTKSIYDFLGIRWFKKYLITDGDKIRSLRKVKQVKINDPDKFNKLYKIEQDTRKYEIIHLIFFAVFLFIIIIKFNNLTAIRWIVILLINLYANIYPIFLQRYNRIRIITILKNNGYKSPYEK